MANLLARGSKGRHLGYATSEELKRRTPLQKFATKFKRQWQLYLMVALPLLYVLIFSYGPMYGIQIAFRQYSIKGGITNSPWVGLAQFMRFFSDRRWTQYVANTVTISLYTIAASFPIPIILALFLHVNEHNVLKKITQNVSYIPHFISTVVMVGLLNQIVKPFNGMIASIMNLFGFSLTTDIRSNPDAFYHLYVWSGVWQGMGWSAIMYVAALAGVPMELHEAAKIDGASRWRRVLAVDLPAIMPTICILLILRLSHVMSVGYEKIFLMQNDTNMVKSQVISTYVYRVGLAQASNYSFGSAVNLMNAAINITLTMIVNWITNKMSDGDYGLF